MKDFNEIYKQIYDNYYSELESLRKKAFSNSLKLICCTLIIGLVLPLIFLKEALIFTIFIVFFITTFTLALNPFGKKYNEKYKKTVITTLIHECDNNLKYDPNSKISSHIYDDAEFEKYDEYNANDYIYGKINGIIDFELGDVRTVDVHRDSDGHTSRTTLFSGLFSASTFNTNINGKIKIRSDKGWLGKLLSDQELMKMDSQEFEKYFDVYTSDKILAMRILTSDIMDFLITYKKDKKRKFEITLKNHKFYIRLHSADMFESTLSKKSMDFSTLHQYFDTLNFMCDFNKKIYNVLSEKNI